MAQLDPVRRRQLVTTFAVSTVFLVVLGISLFAFPDPDPRRGVRAAIAAQASPSASPSPMAGPFTVVLKGTGMFELMSVSGSATIDLREGTALAQAMGLPAPPSGSAYVGWLADSAHGVQMNAGAMQPAGGAGAYSLNFAAGRDLEPDHFDLFAITLESAMNTTNEWKGELVLAAWFPGHEGHPLPAPGASPSPSPSASPTR